MKVAFIQRFKRVATDAELEFARVETDGNRLSDVPFFTGSVHNICFITLFLDPGFGLVEKHKIEQKQNHNYLDILMGCYFHFILPSLNCKLF